MATADGGTGPNEGGGMMSSANKEPWAPGRSPDDVCLELLDPLDLKSPIKWARAWALYQELRRHGNTVTEEQWRSSAKKIRLTSAQADRALDDLVDHSLASLYVEDGQIMIKICQYDPAEFWESGDGGG